MKVKNTFLKIFGCNIMRILDYLIDCNIDVSIVNIMNKTDLSRKTAERRVNLLLENNIIKITRVIGKTKMYKFNLDNQISKKLKEIKECGYNDR